RVAEERRIARGETAAEYANESVWTSRRQGGRGRAAPPSSTSDFLARYQQNKAIRDAQGTAAASSSSGRSSPAPASSSTPKVAAKAPAPAPTKTAPTTSKGFGKAYTRLDDDEEDERPSTRQFGKSTTPAVVGGGESSASRSRGESPVGSSTRIFGSKSPAAVPKTDAAKAASQKKATGRNLFDDV
ncbi:hypothetical protein HDU76_007304, partial [Blyttiomyces sp. JEL0837]